MCSPVARNNNLVQAMVRSYNLWLSTAEAYNNAARYYLTRAMSRVYKLLS